MNNIKYLKRGEKYFPKKLEKLEDCPDILYVLGNEKILNDFSIAMVGGRSCSIKGKEIARKISNELALQNINIVSGLAVGIDSISHEGCLDANGKTIAVLGGGVKVIYPKENIELYEKIIKNGGAIISEQLPYDPPISVKLRNRNRIIAALSSGIVVIEAREKSGSLVTARFAKSLNKKIFVVPGSIDDYNYKGSNNLLVDGAKCVRNADDIFKYYSRIGKNSKMILKDFASRSIPKELRAVYDVINKTGENIDEISRKLRCNPNEVLAKLTLLEIQDFIVQYPGKIFAKK